MYIVLQHIGINMRLIKYISILLIIILAIFYVKYNSFQYQILQGKIFGTYYSIKIKTNVKNDALPNLVEQELENINNKMSVFDKQSEISKINRSPKNVEIRDGIPIEKCT